MIQVRTGDVVAVRLQDDVQAVTIEYRVRAFAAKEGVDERTVRRWIAKGAVQVRRTPGGGIRIIERRAGS